ncbi:hypothetical protein VNO77_19997 [Canavalia gladiata]|uniref:Uncharacterized protein n=1 Tax=Canavalia gladiata TaxID=3824 RepID=A0AAN9QLZ9_CANGL
MWATSSAIGPHPSLSCNFVPSCIYEEFIFDCFYRKRVMGDSNLGSYGLWADAQRAWVSLFFWVRLEMVTLLAPLTCQGNYVHEYSAFVATVTTLLLGEILRLYICA